MADPNLYFFPHPELPASVLVASPKLGVPNELPAPDSPCLFLIRKADFTINTTEHVAFKEIWGQSKPEFCLAFVPHFPHQALKTFGKQLKERILSQDNPGEAQRIPLISWIDQKSPAREGNITGGISLFVREWIDEETARLHGEYPLKIALPLGNRRLTVDTDCTVTADSEELKFSSSLLTTIAEVELPVPGISVEMKTDLVTKSDSEEPHSEINRIGYVTAKVGAYDLDLLPIGLSYYLTEPEKKPSHRFDFRVFKGVSVQLDVYVHPTDLLNTKIGIRPPKNPVAIESYFRTTENEPVELGLHWTSGLAINRVYRPEGQDSGLFDVSLPDGTFFQFVPTGKFYIKNTNESRSNKVAIVCGLAGTEYISAHSPIRKSKVNSNKACLLEFKPNGAAVFTRRVENDRLTYDLENHEALSTSHVGFVGAMKGDASYFVQPEDSPLFERNTKQKTKGKKSKFDNSDFLAHKPIQMLEESQLPMVPMVPFAGYQIGTNQTLSVRQRELLDLSKRLCGKLLTKKRISIYKNFHGFSSKKRHDSSKRLSEVSLGITPQGWLAEVTNEPPNEFTSVLICRMPTEIQNLELRIDCTTPIEFKSAWLNKDIFLIIREPNERLKYKVGSADGKPPIVNLGGWNLKLDSKYIIVKSSNKSVKDLISQTENWTWVEGLTHLNGESQASVIKESQDYFDTKIFSRLSSADAEKQSLYQDLKTAIESPSWNGVLVLEPNVSAEESDGNGLGALDLLVHKTPLAEYFSDTFSAVGFATSKAFVQNNQLDAKETAVFAVVDYDKSSPAKSDVRSASFVLNNLSARFTNGTLEQFKADGTLSLLNLFDQNLKGTDNSVQIKGRYKKVNGKGIYSFATEGSVGIAFDTGVLGSVGVSKIEFKTATTTAPTRTKSSFDFSGWIQFKASKLLGDSQLTFEGIQLSLPDWDDLKKYLDLGFDTSELRFDLNLSKLFDSFLKSFPLKYKTFFYSAQPKGLGELGYLSLSDSKVKYGLIFELDMGTIGSLVSTEPVKVDMFIGWQDALTAGIKFPSWSGGNTEIGIEGVLKLEINKFNIDIVPVKSGQNVRNLFAILFNECSLHLFGEEYGNANVFVFIPETKQKPAWLITLQEAGTPTEELPPKFLAAGQRLKLPVLESNGSTKTRLQDFYDTIRKEDFRYKLATTDCAVSGPSYCSERNWLAGVRLQLDSTVDVSALFVDGVVYGGSLSVPFLSALFKDEIDIVYTKISRTIGALSVDLQISSILNKLGPFGVTIPRLGLTAYTNGGFRFDLGFPRGTNFSRSFQFSLGLLGGRGGFYYGFMHRTNVADSAISLGIGFNVFYGKGIDLGIVSGRFEIGAFGIFETTFSISNGLERFYGLVGVYGFIEGHVSLGFVSGRAKVLIEATAELTYEKGRGGTMKVAARLEGILSITIGIGRCATTYTYDFEVKFSYTWKFGGGGQALQNLATQNIRSLSFRGNLDPSYQGQGKVIVSLFFAPNLAARGAFYSGWNTQQCEVVGLGIASIMLERSTSAPSEKQTDGEMRSRFLMRITEWVLYSIKKEVESGSYSLSEVESLIKSLKDKDPTTEDVIDYTALVQFLKNNFCFDLNQQVPYGDGSTNRLVQFPLPPGLKAELTPPNPFEYKSPWVPQYVSRSVLADLHKLRQQQIYGTIQPSKTSKSPIDSNFCTGEHLFAGYFSSLVLSSLGTLQSHLNDLANEQIHDPAATSKVLVGLFDSKDGADKGKAQANVDAALTLAGRLLMNGTNIRVGDRRQGIYEFCKLETPVVLPEKSSDSTVYPVKFLEQEHEKHSWFNHPKDPGVFSVRAEYFPLSIEKLKDEKLFPKRNYDLRTEAVFSELSEAKDHIPCYLSKVLWEVRLNDVSKIPILVGSTQTSDYFPLPEKFALQAIKASEATEVVPVLGASFGIGLPLKCKVEKTNQSVVFRLPTIPKRLRRSIEWYLLNSSTNALSLNVYEKTTDGLVLKDGIWTIFNNNLSLVSNPPDPTLYEMTTSSLINCANSNESNNNFLTVLERLATVNESGYFLSYKPSSMAAGAFADEQIVELYLVFSSSDNTQIFPGANAVLVPVASTPNGDKSKVIKATTKYDLLPKNPAGSLPIVCITQRPEPSNYLQSLYNSIGYEILETPDSAFAPIEFPMAITPQTVDADFEMSYDQRQKKQMFAALMPAAGLLKQPIVSEALKKIAEEENDDAQRANSFDPYSIIGRTATIGLRTRDYFGNEIQYDAAHPITQVPVTFKFIDRIIEFQEWPGLAVGYKFNSSGDVELTFHIVLDFTKTAIDSDKEPSKHVVDRDHYKDVIRSYQKIFWQVQKRKHDVDASMQIHIQFSMDGRTERHESLERKLEDFLEKRILGQLADALDKPIEKLNETLRYSFKALSKPTTTREIQNFFLNLEMRRPAKPEYSDEALVAKLPQIMMASNLIAPYTDVVDGNFKLNDKDFADAVESFYSGKKQGFALAYSFDESGEKLYWAVRNRLFGISRSNNDDNFFAQKPLGNIGFTGQIETEFLNNFDIDSEMDFVISKYEEIISASKIQELLKKTQNTPVKISELINVKGELSEALSQRTAPIFEAAEQTSKSIIRIYNEALRRDLCNSYKTDCVAQLSCKFDEPYSSDAITAMGSPVLYGRVASENAGNVDSSATKLKLSEISSANFGLSFVSASNEALRARKRSFVFTGAYRITHIERQLSKEELEEFAKFHINNFELADVAMITANEYRPLAQDAHQWLYLINDKPIPLGKFTIPITYRRIPPAPIISGDFARLPKREEINKIEDAHLWDYEMQVEILSPTLDKLTNITALERDEAPEEYSVASVNQLIKCLREFRQKWSSASEPDVEAITSELKTIAGLIKTVSYSSKALDKEYILTVSEQFDSDSTNTVTVRKIGEISDFDISVGVMNTSQKVDEEETFSVSAKTVCKESTVGSVPFEERRKYRLSYINMPITKVNRARFRATVTRNEDLVQIDVENGCPMYRATSPDFVMHSEVVRTGKPIEPNILIDKVIYIDELASDRTRPLLSHIQSLFSEVFEELNQFSVQLMWYHGFEQQPIRKRLGNSNKLNIEDYELTHRVPVSKCLKRDVSTKQERETLINDIVASMNTSWAKNDKNRSTGFFQLDMTVFRNKQSSVELLRLPKLRLPFDSIT